MLDVKNIYKNFGSLKVLEGVSIQINEGEVVAIIGASGSGKSTLLRCMNLLETPTFGEVWMNDRLLTPVDPYLHVEIIRASNTYKKLLESGVDDADHVGDGIVLAIALRNGNLGGGKHLYDLADSHVGINGCIVI